MLHLNLLIFPLLFFEAFLLLSRYIFDRNSPLDKEISPSHIINSNYNDYLYLPLVFYIFPFITLTAVTNTHPSLLWVPVTVSVIITAVSTYYLLIRAFKKYYLTESGLVIFNLVLKTTETIPFSSIREYGYKVRFRSSESYFIDLGNRQLVFYARQIKDKEAFKDYFNQHSIPYYEVDLSIDEEYRE